jgi:hypothetical protein
VVVLDLHLPRLRSRDRGGWSDESYDDKFIGFLTGQSGYGNVPGPAGFRAAAVASEYLRRAQVADSQ